MAVEALCFVRSPRATRDVGFSRKARKVRSWRCVQSRPAKSAASEAVAGKVSQVEEGIFVTGEVCYMFSARCTKQVTGLGATDTYDAPEVSCCCCWLYVAAA